jgi:hypothetical protein
MSHLNAWRIAGAVMIVLALVNFAAQFAIFPTRGDEVVPPNAENSQDFTESTAAPIQDNIIQNIGGLTSPTGISVIVISMIFLAVASGLLRGKPWGVAAQLALGADITFKLINIVSMLAVGSTLIEMFPAVIIIIIEAAVIFLLFKYRATDAAGFDTRRGTPA